MYPRGTCSLFCPAPLLLHHFLDLNMSHPISPLQSQLIIVIFRFQLLSLSSSCFDTHSAFSMGEMKRGCSNETFHTQSFEPWWILSAKKIDVEPEWNANDIVIVMDLVRISEKLSFFFFPERHRSLTHIGHFICCARSSWFSPSPVFHRLLTKEADDDFVTMTTQRIFYPAASLELS